VRRALGRSLTALRPRTVLGLLVGADMIVEQP
jgi:hypothetical protein